MKFTFFENDLLTAVQNLRKSDKFKGVDFSLEAMINKILQIQERNTLRAYNDFLKKIKEQYDQLYDLDKKIVDMISEMEQHKEQILVKT